MQARDETRQEAEGVGAECRTHTVLLCFPMLRSGMPVRSVKDCRVALLLAMTRLRGFMGKRDGFQNDKVQICRGVTPQFSSLPFSIFNFQSSFPKNSRHLREADAGSLSS